MCGGIGWVGVGVVSRMVGGGWGVGWGGVEEGYGGGECGRGYHVGGGGVC